VANHYCTRDAVKAAAGIHGSDKNRVIDRAIAATSRMIDRLTNTWFIPKTETRRYPYPQPNTRRSWVLALDAPLLSTTPTITKDGTDVTAIASADFFVEPINRPPYWWIEIDLESAAFLSAKGTHQRAIVVTSSWGESDETDPAGTVTSGLASSATATSMVCSNAALVGVGNTLLIELEQLFVTEKTTFDTTADLNDTLTADMSDTLVTVTDGTKVSVDEVVLFDSERMLITDITGNNLTVERAYDGTNLAAHSTGISAYTYRTLTVERGVNGTTAATHANSTAIVKYAPPEDIEEFCIDWTLATLSGQVSHWTGQIGGGEAAQETKFAGIRERREQLKRHHRRYAIGAV
jgi:hypothetical protein